MKPRPTATYELEPGYHSARAILNDMVKDGLLVKHRAAKKEDQTLFSLKNRRRPYNDWNRDHEIDCADVFVALKSTGRLIHWQKGWDNEGERHFLKQFGVEYDRRFELEGSDQVFFLEVDRGTEDLKTIQKKLSCYIRLSTVHPEERFTVAFTVQGYRYHQDDASRLSEMMPVLAKARRGNQFVIGIQDQVLADPLAPVWLSPKGEAKLSIATL